MLIDCAFNIRTRWLNIFRVAKKKFVQQFCSFFHRKKTDDTQSTPRQFAGVLMPPDNANPIESNTPQSQQSPLKAGRKRRIRIDDDDESPTFNPLARGIRRGRGRGGRGSRGGRGTLRRQLHRPLMSILSSPDKSSGEVSPFTSPEAKVILIEFLFVIDLNGQ